MRTGLPISGHCTLVLIEFASFVSTHGSMLIPHLFGLIAMPVVVAKKFGWSLNQEAITSMTRGYVGDTQFAVLPTIEALHTMIITVLVQLVSSVYGIDRANLNKDRSCSTPTSFAIYRLYYKSYGENQHLTTFCPRSHYVHLLPISLAGMYTRKPSWLCWFHTGNSFRTWDEIRRYSSRAW